MAREIEPHQSYMRLGKEALVIQSRYAHAKHYKRVAHEMRRLKTYLRRVIRNIYRKITVSDPELEELLRLSGRLLAQERTNKSRLYSIHEPQVECISKRKAHKRYEFEGKVSVATTSRDNWVVKILAHRGNPYDGHTLEKIVAQITQEIGWRPISQCLVIRTFGAIAMWGRPKFTR
jgi:IS5 family transposase